MSQSNPPLIVVMAYNRPDSLRRLLTSLGRASVDGQADVVISVDGGGSRRAEVLAHARAFRWPNGDVEVLERDRLGLVDHFHACGDLTARTGSAVLLEDDLVVGPNFHRWATAALSSTAADPAVAGVCLAAPWFDGYRRLPFQPLLDGSAGFYLQVPWFHGMAWTRSMWQRYRTWARPATPVAIHRAFEMLDEDEWFPDAVRYLVDTDRFYLLPREAHASNTGAAGQHFDNDSDFFQVPMELGQRRTWDIEPLERAVAVYDDHMELSPRSLQRLCPELASLELTVDLLAVRDPASLRSGHVVTTRPTTGAERTWGTAMRPLAMNLHHDQSGEGISLTEAERIITGRAADSVTARRLRNHADRGRPAGYRSLAGHALGAIGERWLRARHR